MPTTDELLKEFYALFGTKGGDQIPGNVGISRSAANVCRDLMKVDASILFDYFEHAHVGFQGRRFEDVVN